MMAFAFICSFSAKAVTSQLTHQLFCISKIDAADKLYTATSCMAPANKWREQKNRKRDSSSYQERKIASEREKERASEKTRSQLFRMTQECHCRP